MSAKRPEPDVHASAAARLRKRALADQLALKDRALDVAAEGITIADARLPDRPLIYVNEGFERATGYTAAEVLGKNCRFLQGPDTDPAVVTEIRAAVAAERECIVEILNYRRDGTTFWNRLSITPVRDGHGEVTHYIGVQSDVTARREAEHGLRRANEALEQDLRLAARVQQALLPPAELQLGRLRIARAFHPCTSLAGDAVGVVAFPRGPMGLYLLDVSGHGVGAALLSFTLNHTLSTSGGRISPRRGRRTGALRRSAIARGGAPQPAVPHGPDETVLHVGVRGVRRVARAIRLRDGRSPGAHLPAEDRTASAPSGSRAADRHDRERDLRGRDSDSSSPGIGCTSTRTVSSKRSTRRSRNSAIRG